VGRYTATKGFTLIEVAVVITVLAILFATFLHFTKSYSVSAKADKLAELKRQFEEAVLQFYHDTGGIPQKTVSLVRNQDRNGHAIPQWSGPYISTRKAVDWVIGNAFSWVRYVGTVSNNCGVPNNQIVFVAVGNLSRAVAQEFDRRVDDGNLGSGSCTWVNNFCGWGSGIRCVIFTSDDFQTWVLY
jgi:prepilin-type N-terminal cleavage/methylation domain-containing protein